MSSETFSQTLSEPETLSDLPVRVRYTNYETVTRDSEANLSGNMRSEVAGIMAVVSVNSPATVAGSRSMSANNFAPNGVGVKSPASQESVEEQIRARTSSMEWQLITLYSERERLEQELGVSEAEEVIALVRELKQRRETQDSLEPVTPPNLDILPLEPATNFSPPTLDLGNIVQSKNGQSNIGQGKPSPYGSPLRVGIQALDRQLQEIQQSMEAQLLSLYGERERLEREIGSGEPTEIVAILRGLRQREKGLLRDLNRLPLGLNETQNETEAIGIDATQANHNREMSQKIREAQIASHPLYQELERRVETLLAERKTETERLTLDEAIEVDAILRSLQERLNVTRDTEAHLVTLYAERETLTEQVGTADAGDIIELVRSLEAEVRELSRQAERNRTASIPREILPTLPSLSRIERDSLDFALIGLDDTGGVLSINEEAERLLHLTPVYIQNEISGVNLFTRLSPCLNNRLVYGRFREGIATDSLDESLTYTLTYKVKPTNVLLHLYRDPVTRTNWILLKARG